MPEVRKYSSDGIEVEMLECNQIVGKPLFKAFVTPEIDQGRDSVNQILVVEDSKFNICAILGLFQ